MVPYTTDYDTLPIINHTYSVELTLYILFIYLLQLIQVVWPNCTLIRTPRCCLHAIIGNNFRNFSYKYEMYRQNWISKFLTLIKCISVVSSDTTFKCGHFICDFNSRLQWYLYSNKYWTFIYFFISYTFCWWKHTLNICLICISHISQQYSIYREKQNKYKIFKLLISNTRYTL